jgi:hypothetical protein
LALASFRRGFEPAQMLLLAHHSVQVVSPGGSGHPLQPAQLQM